MGYPSSDSISFSSFQKNIVELSKTYPIPEENKLAVYSLGLAGETGEVCELLKRVFRGDNDEEFRKKLYAELGDVLAYLALIAHFHNMELDEIAHGNYRKLERRVYEKKQLGTGSDR